jgi:hypothetical protein
MIISFKFIDLDSNMTIIALLIYCAAVIFILHRIIRKKAVSLSVMELSLAFLLKVAMGCLYGYIYLHYYDGDDTWMIHQRSLEEMDKFLHDPVQFFNDFSPLEGYRWAGRRFWPGMDVWIGNIEKLSMAKTLAFFNIFSRSNYYINVVFFNGIIFWGHYWLFSVLVNAFPDKRFPLLLLIFFFPPLLFWLSGIRADGLLLFFLSLLLLHFPTWVHVRTRKAAVFSIIALIGLLVFRKALLLLVAPALVAWFIAIRYNRRPVPVFLLVYGIGGVLFFSTSLISSRVNLPMVIVNRQQEYLPLQGTRFQLDTLQPSVAGFARVWPQAVNNTFFRPYVWEAEGLLQIMTAIEVIVFWVLVLLPFFRKDERWKKYITQPLLLFFLFFGIALYLFIGYTVPFPGAIVRYKVLAELLLLTIPLICTKWATVRVD